MQRLAMKPRAPLFPECFGCGRMTSRGWEEGKKRRKGRKGGKGGRRHKTKERGREMERKSEEGKREEDRDSMG